MRNGDVVYFIIANNNNRQRRSDSAPINRVQNASTIRCFNCVRVCGVQIRWQRVSLPTHKCAMRHLLLVYSYEHIVRARMAHCLAFGLFFSFFSLKSMNASTMAIEFH